jgi:hypothetical protein
MESTLKAAKIALQAVEAQIDTRTKETEHHITKIQNHLSVIFFFRINSFLCRRGVQSTYFDRT